MRPSLSYVLISPARNEAEFIERTILSVVDQTVRPLRWVIVSDGSSDGTDAIVARFAREHEWISLVRIPDRRERDFAGKVQAFNEGYKRVRALEYEALGSLDADISFDAEYFEVLLRRLSEDPSLGLVGTPFSEGPGRTYDYRFTNLEHVSGACQLFRRQCFENIGGYTPMKGGGIDSLAVIKCRMKGWKTRTFTEKVCIHHRPMGTARTSVLASRFKMGVKDYCFGNHPVWEFCRAMYQTTRQPALIGGLAIFGGYLWSSMRHTARTVPPDVCAFVRQEQIQRLSTFVTRLWRSRMANTA